MNLRWRDQGQRDHSVGVVVIQVRGKDEEMRAWTRVLLIRKGRKEKKYMNLEEGLANYSFRAKYSLLIIFPKKCYWNTVLPTCYMWSVAAFKVQLQGQTVLIENLWPIKLKILSVPFREKICQSFLKCRIFFFFFF